MSRKKGNRKPPGDLRVGIAIARNEFDLVSELTEAELAHALRVEAQRIDDFPELLLAIADALDHPEAPIRLKLVRAKRGKPSVESTMFRDLWVADFVTANVADGMKQEAVIAEVQARLGISRATAMKALANGREHQKFSKTLKIYADELRMKQQSS